MHGETLLVGANLPYAGRWDEWGSAVAGRQRRLRFGWRRAATRAASRRVKEADGAVFAVLRPLLVEAKAFQGCEGAVFQALFLFQGGMPAIRFVKVLAANWAQALAIV